MNFYKYHGTGNDFILLDNRDGSVKLDTRQIAHLCHRHFGIGADGLMLLERTPGFDFKMVYYNSDGHESTMCGNGGRCITAFARSLGVVGTAAHFLAIDGTHTSLIHDNGLISLYMQKVERIDIQENHAILNTGSPHYVLWEDDVMSTDVYARGKAIRNLPQFQPGGINVNFVQVQDGRLFVRTYERGVEDETLSCGTGVTAAAIAAAGQNTGTFNTLIGTPGGMLEVSFTKDTPDVATHVVLTGPAVFVFKGRIEKDQSGWSLVRTE